MNWTSISYSEIVDVFLSEAVIRLFWLLLIFCYVYFFTKNKPKTDSLLVPWSFKDAFKVLALLLIFQYGLSVCSSCILKYLYERGVNNSKEIEILTNNSLSILKSLIFFITPLYIIKRYYHSKAIIFGFDSNHAQASIKLGIVVSLIYLCFIFVRLKGFWSRHPDQYLAQINFNFDISTILALIIFIPIAEEILFRGFLYQSIKRKLSFQQAALISSLCFTLFHIAIDENSWIIFLQGYLLAYIFFKSRSLLGCIILHMISNLLRLIADYKNGVVIQMVSWNTLIFICLVIMISSYMILNRLKLAHNNERPARE